MRGEDQSEDGNRNEPTHEKCWDKNDMCFSWIGDRGTALHGSECGCLGCKEAAENTQESSLYLLPSLDPGSCGEQLHHVNSPGHWPALTLGRSLFCSPWVLSLLQPADHIQFGKQKPWSMWKKYRTLCSAQRVEEPCPLAQPSVPGVSCGSIRRALHIPRKLPAKLLAHYRQNEWQYLGSVSQGNPFLECSRSTQAHL